MSKPRKYPYGIIYKDNTHIIYELDKADYEALVQAKKVNGIAELSIGCLDTIDIRAVVRQKVERKKPVKQTEAGLPWLDSETLKWLQENGKGGVM